MKEVYFSSQVLSIHLLRPGGHADLLSDEGMDGGICVEISPGNPGSEEIRITLSIWSRFINSKYSNPTSSKGLQLQLPYSN